MDIDMQNLAKFLMTDEIYKYIIGHIAYILMPEYWTQFTKLIDNKKKQKSFRNKNHTIKQKIIRLNESIA